MNTTVETCGCPANEAEDLRRQNAYTPTVDIVENADGLLLSLDVPGATADGVDINIERGRLTVHASVALRKIGDKAEALLQEYGVGDFRRSFDVGEGVDAGNITASLTDGVLTIRLPRSPELMPRKVPVQSTN